MSFKKNENKVLTFTTGQNKKQKTVNVFRNKKLTKTFIKSLRKQVKQGIIPTLPLKVRFTLHKQGLMLNENTGRLIQKNKQNLKWKKYNQKIYPPINTYPGEVFPEDIYDDVKKHKGKYLILRGRSKIEDEIQVRMAVPTSLFSSWWSGFRWRLMIDSSTPLFENGATLYIANNVESSKMKQSFRDGYQHCLYVPIINKVKRMLDKIPKKPKGENNRTQIIRRSQLNRILKYCEKRKNDGGVHQDKLQEMADAIKIRIKVIFPFTGDEIDVKPDGKYCLSFIFNNISFNHLELADNFQINAKPEYVDVIELTDDIFYWCETPQGDVRKAWKKDGTVLSLSNNSSYNDFVKEHKAYQLKSQTKISTFIEKSCVYNNAMNLHNCKEIDLKKIYQIDESKCYLQNKITPFYNGLGIILTTYEQRQFSINEVENKAGFYLLTNVKYPHKFPKEVFQAEGRIMYSAEVLYLHSIGCQFEITAGAYGEQGKVIDEIDLHKYFDDEEKSYRQAIGRFNCIPQFNTFKMKAKENDYYAHLLYLSERHKDKEKTRVFQTGEGVYDIVCPAKPTRHFSTITSIVLSYARIRMLEFIKHKLYFDDILRINCDGLYLRNNKCQETETMKYKKIELKDNSTFFSGGKYLVYQETYSNDQIVSENKGQINLYAGAGGTGKTHFVGTDQSIVGLCIFSPTWKLAKYISDSYPVTCLTWAKLFKETQRGESLKNIIEHYNVWAFDEVSMMSNEFKNDIITLAKKHNKKIIFMGDIGYQLPCFGKNETPFKIKGVEHIKTFITSYRFNKDDPIRPIAKHLRQMIIDKISSRHQLKWLKTRENIKIINYDDIKPNVRDLIITSTKKNIVQFNKRYSKGIPEISQCPLGEYLIFKKKWCIKTNSPKYKNTEVVISNKKPNTKCEEQYAYTIHSAQGETISPPAFLYIDCRRMWALEHLYTAISRAKSLKQIILVI